MRTFLAAPAASNCGQQDLLKLSRHLIASAGRGPTTRLFLLVFAARLPAPFDFLVFVCDLSWLAAHHVSRGPCKGDLARQGLPFCFGDPAEPDGTNGARRGPTSSPAGESMVLSRRFHSVVVELSAYRRSSPGVQELSCFECLTPFLVKEVLLVQNTANRPVPRNPRPRCLHIGAQTAHIDTKDSFTLKPGPGGAHPGI